MKTLVNILVVIIFTAIFAVNSLAGDIRSAGVKGDWNQSSTWIGGTVPGAADNVTIVNGDTVYYNLTNSTVANIVVGENAMAPTMLFFKGNGSYALTVTGNIIVDGDSAYLYAQTDGAAPRNHSITLNGNLISTGTIDFKTGSTPNNGLLTLILAGTTNSILQADPFVITPSTVNEFYAITINKTGGAKVILQSDIGMANVSTSILTLQSGIVETGSYAISPYATASGSIVGGSQTSYINGNLGRGWPSSGGASNKIFPIGDANKYRPAYLSNTNSAYHLTVVGYVHANANTGSSVLTGGIDKVSTGRYLKIKAGQIPRSGNVPSPFVLIAAGIGYYADDGVTDGNTNLRLAVSFDHRTNWDNKGPTSHTTVTGSTPTQIMSETFNQSVQLDSMFYVSLARVTGTTENSLDVGVGVKDEIYLPTSCSISQNYPNPFNPSTEIKYKIVKSGYVSLKIYDVLGKEVGILVNQNLEPGTYSATWEASDLSGGIYFYKLQTTNFVETRKMILIK
jgi:hypothetical protein